MTMSQAFGARSGLQGMVSSEAGGANEANGSRGLLGPWVLDSWEELRRRRRGKEDEQLKASTSSSIGAGPLANRTGKGKRKQCGTVTARKPKG